MKTLFIIAYICILSASCSIESNTNNIKPDIIKTECDHLKPIIRGEVLTHTQISDTLYMIGYRFFEQDQFAFVVSKMTKTKLYCHCKLLKKLN